MSGDRDKAFKEWSNEYVKTHVYPLPRDAFNAGWKASEKTIIEDMGFKYYDPEETTTPL